MDFVGKPMSTKDEENGLRIWDLPQLQELGDVVEAAMAIWHKTGEKVLCLVYCLDYRERAEEESRESEWVWGR